MSPAICIHDRLAQAIGRARSHEIARKKPQTIAPSCKIATPPKGLNFPT
jgi:hypothetical protein